MLKAGDIVCFDPNYAEPEEWGVLYKVVEVKGDRVDIKPKDFGFFLAPVETVKIDAVVKQG